MTDYLKEAYDGLMTADSWEGVREAALSLVQHLRSQPPPPAPKAEGGKVSDEEVAAVTAPTVPEIAEGDELATRLEPTDAWLKEQFEDGAETCLSTADGLRCIYNLGVNAGRASLAAELESLRLELSQERATHLDTVKRMRDAVRAELAEKDRRIAAWERVIDRLDAAIAGTSDGMTADLLRTVKGDIPAELRPGGKS